MHSYIQQLTGLQSSDWSSLAFCLRSVKSCFHIMDLCRLRPGAYDIINRNKAPFMRPGNPPNLPVAFNKMAAVHPQVRAGRSAIH